MMSEVVHLDFVVVPQMYLNVAIVFIQFVFAITLTVTSSSMMFLNMKRFVKEVPYLLSRNCEQIRDVL